ncbi:Polyamine N-acetyltransferase 1 [Tolypocladium capitatum]|uniref:Polyamine N-acetyltransferase 1 n=1 Tax=Tolypocladium capitatum TaxID=45235 RepID=A0A2K3Q3T6_9HYPO|nr:Polyamine N-acetyltransferase 1 [Tolypocladium capitatum]
MLPGGELATASQMPHLTAAGPLCKGACACCFCSSPVCGFCSSPTTFGAPLSVIIHDLHVASAYHPGRISRPPSPRTPEPCPLVRVGPLSVRRPRPRPAKMMPRRLRSLSLNDIDSVDFEEAVQAIRQFLLDDTSSGEYSSDGCEDGCAIDDSEDENDVLVEIRRALLQERILSHMAHVRQEQIRHVIPFHWAPMLSPLTGSDADACVALERAAFPGAGQGATRGQIEYCIRKCGNLCMGLFNTCTPVDAKGWWVRTLPHARLAETGRGDRSKRVMFAHFIATLGEHPVVTDNDMMYPQDRCDASVRRPSSIGHRFSGRTLCLHSFAVCPEVQGVGIGKRAIMSYLQLVKEFAVADRVALVCKESHVVYFYRVGFKLVGPSRTHIAGNGWYDMVFHLAAMRSSPR